MTPEAWATNLGAMAAAAIAGWQSYQAKKEAKRAGDLSAPTGNGFATKTLEGQKQIISHLERIEDRVDRNQAALTKHLEHHLDKDNPSV